jgi:hypothetical protein
MANQAKLKKGKREAAEVAAVTLEHRLAEVEARLNVSQKLALERGLVVSQNKYRTVIKREKPPEGGFDISSAAFTYLRRLF